MKDSFREVRAYEENPKWENIIKREIPLYRRENDIRSEFDRDYTRIIHSTAYRRLKHKTQVFFSPESDHICTRVEHISHVESISYTIANYLGLNTELTKAIANAHDIGHSPFGHQGEKILSKLSMESIGENFWHEKNGLYLVDDIELLDDPEGNKKNLDLTYAVRDGIISHCGEIDENNVRPREDFIDLRDISEPAKYQPYTWEGCIVKISDKIAYLGRDIADAIAIGILDERLNELYKILEYDSIDKLNNTILINDAVKDLCENSNPEKGLCFSDKMYGVINKIKEFNYNYIYNSDKLGRANRYFELVITNIFEVLKKYFVEKRKTKRLYGDVIVDFEKWISDYWTDERKEKNKNKALFDLNNEIDQVKAIIFYISGMTDNYAIDMYNRIISF